MNKLGIYFIFFATVKILTSCANAGAPTGGPVDKEPPVIKESYPENGSINFSNDKIEITFDEFLKLNNVNQKLIVSPPLDENPEIKLKGKTLIIEINNDLKDSTTYTFNFNDAITDLNEGNAIKEYKYVFSTGEYIDSLQLSGKLINAFDHKPEIESFVLLYKTYEDSVPLKKKPYYITKVDKNGDFKFTNLASSKYLIFALEDKNSNYIFDLPNEKISFIDSLLEPKTNIEIFSDTIKLEKIVKNKNLVPEDAIININDTVGITSFIDTIITDSIFIREQIVYSPNNIKMLMFEEYFPKQYLVSSSRISKERLSLIFNMQQKRQLILRGLNFESENWYFVDTNKTNDTINVWITDSLVYNIDTLNLVLNYLKTDSINNFVGQLDTVKYKKPTKKKKREKIVNNNLTNFTLKPNFKNNGKVELDQNLYFTASVPIGNINYDKIKLYELIDTVETQISANIYLDTINTKGIIISNEWKENQNYSIKFDSSAVIDMYNQVNNINNYLFSTGSIEDYGTLFFNIENITSSIILQLMNNESEILKEYYIDKNKQIKISYLKPGTYSFKLIIDENNNKKWDTGNYLEKLHPEKVMFYKKPIIIRANWDIEETWDLLDNNIDNKEKTKKKNSIIGK